MELRTLWRADAAAAGGAPLGSGAAAAFLRERLEGLMPVGLGDIIGDEVRRASRGRGAARARFVVGGPVRTT